MKSLHLFVSLFLLLASIPLQADEVDKYINAEMKKRQIPGVALAVIKDGKVIKMKGYGQDSPLLTPEFDAIEVAGPWLKDLKSFTFVACEDAKASRVERFGVPVNRICYYRAGDPLGTRYFLFYLTTEGKVADIVTISNTE